NPDRRATPMAWSGDIDRRRSEAGTSRRRRPMRTGPPPDQPPDCCGCRQNVLVEDSPAEGLPGIPKHKRRGPNGSQNCKNRLSVNEYGGSTLPNAKNHQNRSERNKSHGNPRNTFCFFEFLLFFSKRIVIRFTWCKT